MNCFLWLFCPLVITEVSNATQSQQSWPLFLNLVIVVLYFCCGSDVIVLTNVLSLLLGDYLKCNVLIAKELVNDQKIDVGVEEVSIHFYL